MTKLPSLSLLLCFLLLLCLRGGSVNREEEKKSIIRSTCFKSYHFNNLLHQSNNTSKILTLCKLGRLKDAINTLFCTPVHQLPSSTYSALLQLCIDSKAEKEGRCLHNHLSAIGFVKDVHLSTKLVIFYSKISDGLSARQVFDEMTERTIVTWTAMISCYSQSGYPEEALEIFNLMHCSGFRPNQYTYGSALRACCSVGCLISGEQIHGCVVKNRYETEPPGRRRRRRKRRRRDGDPTKFGHRQRIIGRLIGLNGRFLQH